MKFIPTPIEGLLEVHPTVFGDERGYFMESYNKRVWEQAGLTVDFVQDNESLSSRGVLRGLHFQSPPRAQGKFVTVGAGAVYDVAVDLRVGSPTYGRTFGVVLTAAAKNGLWIPAGFAHGFLTLEDQTVFRYKCTDTYAPETEGCVAWNDPHLSIDWAGIWQNHPACQNLPFLPQLSAKDQRGTAWEAFSSPVA